MKHVKRRRVCSDCKIKSIRLKNKSGLCVRCYHNKKNQEYRIKNKLNHICVTCGKKVNKKIIYPDGLEGPRIEKYPVRCYKCLCKSKKNGK